MSEEEDLHAGLSELGYEPTNFVSHTGRFWVHRASSRSLQIPFATDGTYPGWMLEELRSRAQQINDEAVSALVSRIDATGKAKRRRRLSPKP